MHRRIVAGIVFTSLLVFLSATSVSAYSATDVTKKALMQALSACYDGNGFVSEFKTVGAYTGASSLYNKKNTAGSELPLPTGDAFHKIHDSDLSCKDLFEGHDSLLGGKIDNVYKFMGHPAPAKGASDVGDWLQKYAGYKKTETLSDSGKCVKFTFTYTKGAWYGQTSGSTSNKTTDQICVDTVENGKIKGTPHIVKDGGWNTTKGLATAGGGYSGVTVDTFTLDPNSKNLRVQTSRTTPVFTTIESDGKSWDSFVNEIVTAIPKTPMVFETQASQNGPSEVSKYKGKEEISKGSAGGASGSYSLDGRNSAKTAIKNLYGTKDLNTNGVPKVTEEEVVHIYMYYFEKLFKAKVSCSISDDEALGNGYEGPIRWFESGKTEVTKDCYVISHSSHDNVNGVDDESGMFQHENIGYSNLLDYFKNLKLTKLEEPSEASPTNPEDNPSDPPEKEPSCFDGGGSLGWILCPLLESMGKAVDFLYKEVIEPFLQVNTQLFRGNVEVRDPNDPDKVIQEKSGSVGAWGIFRDIANIVLVLFFIFILFSQISGFGIDNYGIKKLLPKIIVAAILINLSYIICQIAVDLSNILGFGLKRMMDEMAEGITIAEGDYFSKEGYTASGNIVSMLSVILATGIAGLAIWSQGLVAAILAALAAVLVAVIGVIFVFALLSVRQAGVILLVVISPVAMACYMLPNTKSLFNKWLKAFQGLLLLYPICGLLIGAGNFASKVLLSTDTENFFIALSAMLINIVPFFFIPTLLKGCFAAMGNIGARISGVGRNISGQAKRSINGSELAQRKRSEQAEMRRMRRAGVKYDKDGNLILTKRGIRQNTKAERTGWRGMSAGAAARLNAERASFSRNATSSNKYVGDGAEGQLELDRMAQEQRDRHSEVDDTILAIQSGNMSYMGDTFGGDGKITGSEQQTVDVHDIGSMQKALTHYLRHSDGNEQNIQALVKTLSQKGDDGRAAVRQSMEDAIKQSGDNGQKLASSGVRAYSAEIMDGFAKDYKENARTTFDFAAGNQAIKDDTDTSTLSMPTTVNAGALKAATVGGIDEGELTRVVDTFNNDQTSAEDKATIARVAYDAINSESGTSIKEKNRARLQELANHHIVKTMDCAALDASGKPIGGPHERISLRGDGKYINEQGAVVKISSYEVIE